MVIMNTQTAGNGGDSLDAVARVETEYRALLSRRRLYSGLVWTALLLAAMLAGYEADFSLARLIAGMPHIGDYVQRTLPDLTLARLFDDSETKGSVAYWFYRAGDYARLLLDTAAIALIGTVLGAGAAFALCFGAARNLAALPVFHLIRRCLDLCRSVPDIVFALCFVWAYGVGPLAGILAIAVHTTGSLGKLFSEANEAVDPRPLEGLEAAGADWLWKVRFAVLPQVLPTLLSYTVMRLEINIRSASIIGLVGAGGIGQELYYVVSFNYYQELSAMVIMIVGVVFIADLLSERLRHAILEGSRG